MFLSRRYRPNKWPFYCFLAIELPLTIALLALFGIAAPDTYRTKLWQDGADNGFNSSPSAGLYAAANYRPYTTPKVWSQFITNYNVVIVVLSMFIMLVKSIMYMLHVFPPILSALVHAILVSLYTVSVYYQASSDKSDPEHPQNGPPWYITKSCSVTLNKNYTGYCQQAKASFACTVTMLGIFVLYFGFAVWSCLPSRAQKAEYYEKRAARAERRAKYEAAMAGYAHEDSKLAESAAYPVQSTTGQQHGILNPMTPRTLAFNTLGGTRDLPLRNHFSSPNAPSSPTYAVRSPDIPRSPINQAFEQHTIATNSEAVPQERTASPQAQIYFPPPPKKPTK